MHGGSGTQGGVPNPGEKQKKGVKAREKYAVVWKVPRLSLIFAAKTTIVHGKGNAACIMTFLTIP